MTLQINGRRACTTKYSDSYYATQTACAGVWPCKKLVSTFGRLRAAYYSRCKWFEYHDNLVHRITMDD